MKPVDLAKKLRRGGQQLEDPLRPLQVLEPVLTEADRSVTTTDQRLGRLTESWRSTGIERDPQKLF